MIPPSDQKSKFWSVVRVSSGNFLEMYDFMVFGYYASAIGAAFFPSGNPFISLMLSLMTFGAGFLMRPLGALVLGAYTDTHGRRAGGVSPCLSAARSSRFFFGSDDRSRRPESSWRADGIRPHRKSSGRSP